MDIKFKLRSIWNEIERFPQNIENILSWIPVLWNNWDFDSEFLLDIMKFKLSKMEKYFRKYGMAEDSESIADKIHSAIGLIDKLCDDVYEEEAYKRYYDKYPFMGLEFSEIDIDGQKYMTLKPMSPEQRELFLTCTADAELLHKYYKDQLFEILSEFRNWWD